MSASFFRPTPAQVDAMVGEALEAAHKVIRPNAWRDSRDALDIAGDICDGAAEIKRAGDMLMAFPADAEERMKARVAARTVIALCDRLEALA